MPKQQRVRVGNKAKGRQSTKRKSSGYYKQRFNITERNRKRKIKRHLKKYPEDGIALAKALKLGLDVDNL